MNLLNLRRRSTCSTLWRAGTRGLVSAMLLVCALPTHAVLLSHSVGFDIQSQIRGTQPSLNFRAAVPLFDATLGTLQQVDIVYNFDLALAINISNRTLDPTTVDLGPTSLVIEGPRFFDRFNFGNVVASTAIDETLDVPAGRPRTFGSITLTLPGRAAADIDIDSRFSRTSRPLTIRNIVLRPQGNVTPFIGTDDLLLDFTALTRAPLDLPSTGSILNGISSSTAFTLDGSVDVTYDYLAAATAPPPGPAAGPTPAPAPATFSLALAGLLGLGLSRRRRARRTS